MRRTRFALVALAAAAVSALTLHLIDTPPAGETRDVLVSTAGAEMVTTTVAPEASTTTVDGEALEAFYTALLSTTTTTVPPTVPPTTAPPPAPTTVAPLPPPPTVPAPVPATVPPPATGIEGIIYAAAAEFGVSGDFMVCVARRESGLNPSAVNSSSGALGLFQHLPQYWGGRASALGYGYDSWSDPTANARVSAWLLQTSGPSHWASTAAPC